MYSLQYYVQFAVLYCINPLREIVVLHEAAEAALFPVVIRIKQEDPACNFLFVQQQT